MVEQGSAPVEVAHLVRRTMMLPAPQNRALEALATARKINANDIVSQALASTVQHVEGLNPDERKDFFAESTVKANNARQKAEEQERIIMGAAYQRRTLMLPVPLEASIAKIAHQGGITPHTLITSAISQRLQQR